MPRLGALVWDLDGTLIDSAPDIQASLNRVLGMPRFRPLELIEVKHMLGAGARTLVERAIQTAALEPVAESSIGGLFLAFTADYRRRTADLTTLCPFAIETLRRFQALGVRHALCTNKPHAHTLQALRQFALDTWFDAVVGADLLPVCKPDAAPALHGLRLLGVPREEAIFVGDTEIDAQTAQAVGMPAVILRGGYSRVPVEDLGADALIDDLSELEAAVRSLGYNLTP